jgi:hypothetical protein
MNIEPTNLLQIRHMGIEVLVRELGPVAMIRFLQQFEVGVGDYSKERHQWLGNITMDDIVEKTVSKRKFAKQNKRHNRINSD